MEVRRLEVGSLSIIGILIDMHSGELVGVNLTARRSGKELQCACVLYWLDRASDAG